MWEQEVLLNLRRQYSKDETVALMSKELSEAHIEIGMLKSEISELKDELKLLKQTSVQAYKSANDQLKKENKALRSQLNKSGASIDLQNKNQSLISENKKLKKDKEDLIIRLASRDNGFETAK